MRLTVNYCRGARYLGGYIGGKEGKEEWVKAKAVEWATSVKILGRIARNFPQSAYAGFTFCLQCEWEYISRVIPGVAHLLTPIEEAIRGHFLPALYDVPLAWITGDVRARLA
ncbi:hypothetical protein ACHAXR_004802, partial [Thalassiosira sp. AJA248-18]